MLAACACGVAASGSISAPPNCFLHVRLFSSLSLLMGSSMHLKLLTPVAQGWAYLLQKRFSHGSPQPVAAPSPWQPPAHGSTQPMAAPSPGKENTQERLNIKKVCVQFMYFCGMRSKSSCQLGGIPHSGKASFLSWPSLRMLLESSTEMCLLDGSISRWQSKLRDLVGNGMV